MREARLVLEALVCSSNYPIWVTCALVRLYRTWSCTDLNVGGVEGTKVFGSVFMIYSDRQEHVFANKHAIALELARRYKHIALDDASRTMASSRIFVKGLPPSITEVDFRKHFAAEHTITDAKLISRRRIGYVGYKRPEDAAKAVKFFNKSFIRMSRIDVEIARPV